MKKCSKCKTEKALAEFSRDRSKKDGLCSTCKVCDNARWKVYYKTNKSEILTRWKVHHKAKQKAYHKANRPEILAKMKVYYKTNKSEISARKKVYYKTNRSEILAKHKVYSDTVLKPGYWTVYLRRFKGVPIYVGQTSQRLTTRDNGQYAAAAAGYVSPMSEHIRNNKREDYTIEPLIYCSNKETALRYENRYIEEYKTDSSNGGCNVRRDV